MTHHLEDKIENMPDEIRKAYNVTRSVAKWGERLGIAFTGAFMIICFAGFIDLAFKKPLVAASIAAVIVVVSTFTWFANKFDLVRQWEEDEGLRERDRG